MAKKRTWEEQRRIDQQNWYDEMHTAQIKLKLNRKTDADILEWLRKQQLGRTTSMQGEIKRLIRQEIERIGQKESVYTDNSPHNNMQYAKGNALPGE